MYGAVREADVGAVRVVARAFNQPRLSRPSIRRGGAFVKKRNRIAGFRAFGGQLIAKEFFGSGADPGFWGDSIGSELIHPPCGLFVQIGIFRWLGPCAFIRQIRGQRGMNGAHLRNA